jgi:hypothetical protein
MFLRALGGRSRRGLLPGSLLFSVSILLGSASAAAAQDLPRQELRVEVGDGGTWDDAVTTLQHDLSAQGQTVWVRVFDASGHRARCGRYALSFDVPGALAFAVGECDPANDATEITLVSRTNLFSHEGVVPRPRAVTLTATEVRIGDETGGAAVTGGSALDCSVGIRPYLDDIEHGTVVYLTPDRFEITPTDTMVIVEAQTDGWSLHAHASAALTIRYDVIDRATREVVLSEQAILTCSDLATPTSAPTTRSRTTAPPTFADRAARVVLLDGTDPGRASEVIAIVDVVNPGDDVRGGVWMLRQRAAELGADAVVGVEMHRGGRRGLRLSGLAIRYTSP